MKEFRSILIFILALIALAVTTSFSLPLEIIQVRIFAHLKINALSVSVASGSYKMMGDAFFIDGYKNGLPLKIQLREDSIVVSQDKVLGVYKYVKFFGTGTGELKIKLIDPDRKLRIYQENLSFAVVDGAIRIINEIDLDNYIAGVTEAEAGSRSTLEFYKVQSILARTFALAHINKHVTEGFSLCDQVHCQAYFGRPHDLSIYKAIAETKDKVVVDENLNLIVAAFHSNSGGQTANSEDVWGSRTPYLRSVLDTFSNKMPNARWERKMLADDWLSYLKLKHNYPVGDSEARQAALNFRQDNRKNFLEASAVRVPLKNIRLDLQLKSTFFDITPLNADSVIFKGHGYGHGLGMPQEGAMRMVKLGYNYVDVLNFYYQDIQLIDLHKLNFFKDE
jgi:stage II sporulation protein D